MWPEIRKKKLREMASTIADKYAKDYLGMDSSPDWLKLAVIEGYTQGLKYALKKMED